LCLSALPWVTGIVVGLFVMSTLPGLRPRPGYDLVLDGLLNNAAYALIAALCLARAVAATRYHRSWFALAAGLALYGAGNIVWTLLVRTQEPPPFPSLADGLWLSFYPSAFIAMVLLVREIAEELPLSMWLDGVIGGLAVASFAAALLAPVLAVTGGSASAVLTTLAYPLLDVLLLLVVTAVLALFSWRPPPGLWLLAAGLILLAVTDGVYLFSAAAGTYEPGGPSDGGWVLATLAVALAPGGAERRAGVVLPPWVLLGIPVGAALAALALLVYGQVHQMHPVAIVLSAATVVVALARLVVTFREVSRLEHSHRLALTDDLTGLGNRRAFYDRVHLGRCTAARQGRRGALLLLDLDRFKEVNDSLGHHAGDELLRQVASRLGGALHGADDFLARLGGDEFAVLLYEVEGDGAEAAAERVREALAPPFCLDAATVRIAASVGISLFPEQGDDASALLRCADIAMYRAKGQRCGHVTYSPAEDRRDGQDRLRTLEELRHAVLSRTLAVHYQPKVDARTRAVSGVEALVRWDHPTRGLLLPEAFLRQAEDAGLMRELTDGVLGQSLDQVRRWWDNGRELSVAVNLSASSLVDAELPQRVQAALLDRLLPAAALQLEITEGLFMGDQVRACSVLGELRQLGVRIAVDDFGTGYSSLGYLRDLPIDELKLDRSFVEPMTGDVRAAAIVRSTIELAHTLGLTLVAEGVEDAAALDLLTRAGCDQVQGFFFAPPLPAADLERWLDERCLALQAAHT